MFCQSQAYPTENKPEKSQIFLFFYSKKVKGVQKSQNFKIWLRKSQIDNDATQELKMRIKYARKLLISVMYTSPENLIFLFPCWDIIKCLNASMLKTVAFELVQQFYHATEFGNVANTVSACQWRF